MFIKFEKGCIYKFTDKDYTMFLKYLGKNSKGMYKFVVIYDTDKRVEYNYPKGRILESHYKRMRVNDFSISNKDEVRMEML